MKKKGIDSCKISASKQGFKRKIRCYVTDRNGCNWGK